jgi:hypothetical protein
MSTTSVAALNSLTAQRWEHGSYSRAAALLSDEHRPPVRDMPEVCRGSQSSSRKPRSHLVCLTDVAPRRAARLTRPIGVRAPVTGQHRPVARIVGRTRPGNRPHAVRGRTRHFADVPHASARRARAGPRGRDRSLRAAAPRRASISLSCHQRLGRRVGPQIERRPCCGRPPRRINAFVEAPTL